MSHPTAAANGRKPRPVHGTVRVYVQINGTLYAATPLRPHPEVARRAWRLRKADGTAYTVHLGAHGPECTCPDWLWRRQANGQGCKHVKALIASTLL